MKKQFEDLVDSATADELEEFVQYANKKISKKRKQEAREMKKKEAEEKREKIAQLKKMAKELGVDVKIKTKPASAGTKSPIAFQHPKDSALTWTGRGRKPLWVIDWESKGGLLDHLKV